MLRMFRRLSISEGKGNLEPTTIDTRAEFYKDLDFPEFDFSDVKGRNL
jgi:magnesium chelatase family protein